MYNPTIIKSIVQKKQLRLVIIVLFSAIIIYSLEMVDLFHPLQLKGYDAQFYMRAKMGVEQLKAPIVIVEIDDRTFKDKAFRIPQNLWHNYFGKVIEGLADGRAKVIGLDYLLPRELFDDIVPNYSRIWLKAFTYAKRKGIPVIIGFVEMRDQQILPQSRYLQIIGPEQIGFFNLTTDDDDFIRRQRLFFPSKEGDKRVYSFSYLIARAFKKDLSPPSDTIYIDYLWSDSPFSRHSFSDIYQRTLKKDIPFLKSQFQDKIILIGSTDSLTQDRHPTPLYYLSKRENKRSPGAEIAAHTINTLLGRHFFSETPAFLRFGIYLTLSLIVTLITIFFPQRLVFIFFPALILLYCTISLIFFVNYLIIPLVPGVASIILSQISSFSYRYYSLDREKRRIRSIFQRFLPSKVVSELLATKDADFFRGENKRLCILFSDIRSFTKYSENKSPIEVVSRLNEYFEAMSSIVLSEGGMVDKFLGDGIMAFFGAFDEHKNPSLAGARAALKMLDELEILNRRWTQQGQETFSIGIGIHTGEVKVGNIGSHNKTEYTIIGDAVNIASRLQDKTKGLGETIVISEAVYNDLSGEIVAIDKGVEEIRGRSPIRIYALKGIRSRL